MITFNRAPYIPKAQEYVADVIKSSEIAGDGKYTKLCSEWMENKFSAKKVLLTTSCTAALEMAAILLDIQPGDEVIMPSYTFVSTANAFAMYGAKTVFVDIRPDTMNIDEKLIEAAITEKTKAIVVVHYAGVACEMDVINNISHKYNIPIIEDAAQGVMATYKDQSLGTIGDLGCYSFHETKNYSMGEGGAILINNSKDVERAEIIREKGTDRAKFFRGQVDKYTWVDVGSSYLQSELNCAYLYGQIEDPNVINNDRLKSWDLYYDHLRPLEEKGCIQLPKVPDGCVHNAHMFYIKAKDLDERTRLISYLKESNIGAAFHYIPLHSAPAGKQFGRFHGEDRYTTKESERLLRLPLYYGLTSDQVEYVCEKVNEFYK